MRKNIGLLLAMGAMFAGMRNVPVSKSQDKSKASGKPKVRTASKHRGTPIKLEYPEHYTNQQRGFTPSGGAKLHFQHSNLNNNPYQIGRTILKGKVQISMQMGAPKH